MKPYRHPPDTEAGIRERFETVWTPSRDAPSLIHDPVSRPDSTQVDGQVIEFVKDEDEETIDEAADVRCGDDGDEQED